MAKTHNSYSDRLNVQSNRRKTFSTLGIIIVTFASYRTRSTVFHPKKNLTGTGVVVTESLTSRRYKLLLAAQEKFGHRSVGSIDGRIMATVNNKKITTHADKITINELLKIM